jgi:phosphoenolpyruvate synthase/pyruvate phosphate dikinase
LKKEELLASIPHLYEQNKNAVKQHAQGSLVNLMIQPFIEARVGGVLFFPWKYFSQHAVIEFSSGGAQKAVSGENSQLAAISIEEKLSDLVPLPDNLSAYKAKFVKLLKQLSEQVHYPYDMEWALDKSGDLIILQIRPMTRALNALKSASKIQIEHEEKRFNELSPGKWSFSAFSESLGCLSPLSFSIFEKLYEESRAHFQKLGFKADCPLFFSRAQNGMVYVNQTLEKAFFKNKNFMTPFWRSFSQQKELDQTLGYCQQLKASEVFDEERLMKLFQSWQTASVFYSLDKTKDTELPSFEVGEYECTSSSKKAFPSAKPKTWAEARQFLKQCFIYELQLIPGKKPTNPYLSCLTYEELGSDKALQLGMKRYQEELPSSILDYPVNMGEDQREFQEAKKISGSGKIKAPAFIIKNPHQFRGEIPDGVILVAPFFNNDWVSSLTTLKGVILEQGGHLSHSAIVARELSLPYFIHYGEACEEFKQGKELEMDCGKRIIMS